MYNGHLSIEEVEQLIQQKGPAENQSHLQNCRQCNALLEKYQAVSAKLDQLAYLRIGARNCMNCPDETVWFDVASGTISSEESLGYVRHAADCEACGQKLRAATRMFQEELTEEEEKKISALPSASQPQRKKLAERLVGAPDPRSESIAFARRKRGSWRWLSYGFAAAAALVLAAFFSLGPLTDTMLARGYTQRGTLELRIDKAAPPKEGARGGIEGKEPISLVVADLLIRLRLTLSPSNPDWLGEKGRLELIEGKPTAALADLQEANRLYPKSKVISLDLASAYSQTGKKEDLFRAEEQLLSVLSPYENGSGGATDDRQNLMAVYNLAIMYELTGSLEQAAREWEVYLNLDRTGAWAEQARQRLEKLKSHQHGKAPPLSSAGVPEWWSYIDSGEPNAVEPALETTLIEWLPRGIRASKDLEKLLNHLSFILRREHADDWLSDVLRAGRDPRNQEAFQALRIAIGRNMEGQFELAARGAIKAESIFERTDNTAGFTRAKLEEIYAYQRGTSSNPCLRASTQLENLLSSFQYQWIKIQLLLDEASCLNQLGRPEEARVVSEKALGRAERSRYATLLLRAEGIVASQATSRGDVSAALNWDIHGLREYWLAQQPVERGYQFYSDITFNTERLGLWHVTYDVGREALHLIQRSPHKELEAAVLYRLGKAALILNKDDEARAQIARADSLLAAMPQTPAIRAYRVDGLLGAAKAEMDVSHTGEAISILETSVGRFPPTESRLVARRLAEIKGEAALKHGMLAEAAQYYSTVSAMNESALKTLNTVRERLLWMHQSSSSYRTIVQLKLSAGDVSGALDSWETYKAALTGSTARATVRRLQARLAPGQAFVAYAFLPIGLVAWEIDKQGAHWAELQVGTSDLHHLLAEFAEECSTQDSDLKQLQTDAKRLYRTLLGPFRSYLFRTNALIVEEDDDFETVPFGALIAESGRYLNEDSVLTYSPGLETLLRIRSSDMIHRDDKALIVGAPEIAQKWKNQIGTVPSARTEAESIAARFNHPVLLTGRDATLTTVTNALPHSEIFHFAGHAIQTNSGVSLLLSPASGGSENDLLTISDLSRDQLGNLRLVALAACSTASLNPGTLERLVDPFLSAGVPHILVTRWQINSPTTAVILRDWYRKMLSGSTVAESLRLALVSTSGRPSTTHPYFWASFTLLGWPRS